MLIIQIERISLNKNIWKLDIFQGMSAKHFSAQFPNENAVFKLKKVVQEFNNQSEMTEMRPFTHNEDQIIKYLHEEQKITKWAIIARKLTLEYNIPRNAKQCRDRYQQYLHPSAMSEWTPEEERKLFKLHDRAGNKWALIAMEFPGKSDNIVKNHFYSKLRKSMRRLNTIIKKHFKREFKQLKIGVIYKIVEGFEEKFKEKPIVDEEVSEVCKGLKNQLLQYANQNQQTFQQDFSQEHNLLTRIFDFNRNYKRKSKKQRRNSLQTSQLFKVPERRLQTTSDYEESSSEYSFPISHNMESDQENPPQKKQIQKLGIIIEQSIRQSQNSKISLNFYRDDMMFDDKMSDIKPNSVEEMLKGSGALEMSKFPQHIYGRAQSSRKSASNRSDFEKINMFEQVRFSGGLKTMQIEQDSELRFSGGYYDSNQMMEDEMDKEGLYRSHK